MLPRWLCVVCLLLGAVQNAPAQQTKDPLRFVPSQAEWVLKVDHPREVLATIEKNELFQQAQKLAGVREYYDSTNFQRLYQLIAYFEKQLGADRDELLGELTQGGLVVAARFSPPQAVLLVVQAKDEKKLRRFVDLALEIIEKELQRQESKDKVVRSNYQGHETGHIGAKVHFAIADGALLVASAEAVIKLALDLPGKKMPPSILSVDNFVEARMKAPPQALAWTWFHLEEIRKIPDFKNGLDASALDPAATLVFGGLVDLLKRSPYVTAALTKQGEDFRLGISMPRGREGMAALSHMILPPDGQGTLPLLQPPHTVASSSYFLDLGQFWEKRVDILGKKNGEALSEGDKNLAKFLGGIKLSKLLGALGTHHRFVVTQKKESSYNKKPNQQLQSYALVVDMRDPSFAKDMNTIFRSAALLATFKFGLFLKEETVQGCDMVSYFFSETKKVEGDPDGIRFNFSPTYVTVGDNFVISSTAELARDLIATLKAEQKQKPGKATMHTQIYASGLADLVRANQDALMTQLILSQALSPKTAKEELRAITNFIEQLGTLRLETNYGANDFRYDILWQKSKK